MKPIPPDLPHQIDRILAFARTVEGQLSEKDMRFLALAASCPTAAGEILEIGSFKGKSTVILTQAAALAGQDRVVAVDPMTSPAATDTDLKGEASTLSSFWANMKRAGVEARVELQQMRSDELARSWNRPIRLLWIDGDHTYAGTKMDLELFRPHLANGAIVALHDVLYRFEGPVRVFAEEILASENFGAAGLCGYIGWAQYFTEPPAAERYREYKQRLQRAMNRLLPYVASGRAIRGLDRVKFKLLRMMAPQSPPDAAWWAKTVTRFE